ncbi:MAG: GDSL-type esterase/lipase family protein [Lachnospira sp.]|nr:GDSL-type esterase/lipase family protein [Lachnospira sp.]
MHILCFGDSNTYGYKPDGTGRFDENTRWTGLLQKKLGTEFRVIEEGLCGRTTVFQDEFREGRRGVDAIGTIVETHNPIDVLIIMLGTNDCKSRYGASAGIIAKGLEQIIVKAREKSSQKFKLLVISPIHLGKGVGDEAFDPEFDSDSERVSLNLAKEYKKVSEANDVLFLDASTYATPSSIDREHMDEAGHQALADGIFNILQKNYTDFSLD